MPLDRLASPGFQKASQLRATSEFGTGRGMGVLQKSSQLVATSEFGTGLWVQYSRRSQAASPGRSRYYKDPGDRQLNPTVDGINPAWPYMHEP